MNNTLADTKKWFTKAVPAPTPQNLVAQTGCHFEEVGEMLESIVTYDSTSLKLVNEAITAITALANHFKDNSSALQISCIEHVDLLDSLCDQIVTAVGVGHMCGYDIIRAMDEVNASNFSKFIGGVPVFNENRKIIKGSAYFAPSLHGFTSHHNF